MRENNTFHGFLPPTPSPFCRQAKAQNTQFLTCAECGLALRLPVENNVDTGYKSGQQQLKSHVYAIRIFSDTTLRLLHSRRLLSPSTLLSPHRCACTIDSKCTTTAGATRRAVEGKQEICRRGTKGKNPSLLSKNSHSFTAH